MRASTATSPLACRAPTANSRGHLGGGVADVDLAARDVERPAVERRGLGEPGDRVLGGGVRRGVRPRGVRRDGPVVDDAAASRVLRLHQPDRLLRAEERAAQVHVDHGAPLLHRHVLERRRRRADPGVVEQQVEPSEPGARWPRTAHVTEAGSPTSVGTASVRDWSTPRLARGLLQRLDDAGRPARRRSRRRPGRSTTARPMPDPAPVTIATFKGVSTAPKR